MGKEWYWAGSRSSKRGGGAETQIPSGCICAVFQAFDFHPFHFSINHQQQQPSNFKSASSIPQDMHTVPKGAEAPRNSLESQDGTVSSISKEENLKNPKNIRIKTSGSTRAKAGNLNDLSSEISSSPGTRTPTLVARLMGLDLLPDVHSSSSSSSSSCLSTPNQQGHPHLHHHLRPRQHMLIMKNRTGSDNAVIRSLPETPRMSSARRSDVEHRLSLQINKENMVHGEDLELPRFSFSKRKYDENINDSRSPRHYARQIVKQVKESVSRKVGLDITNSTVKSREQGREEFGGQFRFKKSPKTSVKSIDESSPGKYSSPSDSPRLSRFMDNKHKPSTKPSPLTPKDQNTHSSVLLKPPSPPPVVNIEPQLPRVLTKVKPQALPEQELQNRKPVPKCKKTTNEKFNSRLNKPPQTSIRNMQEESFIIRPPLPTTRANDIKTKSKSTHPLPSNLLNNLNTVPNLLPVKTDPSPPATKIRQKQVSDNQEPRRSTHLSSCSCQRYKQEATHKLANRGTNDEDKSNGASTTTELADDEGAEFQYITTILSRTGVHKATVQPHFQFQWFSPTHPLDPSVFHQLELEHYPTSNSSLSSPSNDKDSIFTQKKQLGPSCNRRLLFDLVDEVMSEILVRPKCYRGLLLETVWKRVRSFPRARCDVLEDIDGLIEMEDMKEEEEGEEGLMAEIERKILETLVHETVTVMVGGVEVRWVR